MNEEAPSLPTPVTLDEADAKAAKELVDEAAALQRFVDTLMQQGQVRQQALQAKQGAFWQLMQQKYGIDATNVHWAPSNDGSAIVPLSVNLGYASPEA